MRPFRHALHLTDILLFIHISFVCAGRATAGTTSMAEGSGHYHAAPAIEPNIERQMNLEAALQHQNIHQPEIFSTALRIIHEIQSTPSCNQQATLSLINSCKSLEAVKDNPEALLDTVRSDYAARLALCEISEAKVTPPPQCRGLEHSTQPCKASRFAGIFGYSGTCQINIPKDRVQACINALSASSQWWISFSNARQNGFVICQASRDAIEKDRTVTAYKTLTEVVSTMSSTLGEAIQQAAAELMKQKTFAEEVLEQQQEVQLRGQKVESLFERLMSSMVATFESSMGNMRGPLAHAKEEIDQLNDIIHRSTVDTRNVSRNILDLLTEANAQHAGNLQEAQEQWSGAHTQAHKVQDELSLIQSSQIAGLQNGLQITEALMMSFHNSLQSNLTNLGGAFDKLHITVEDATNSVAQISFSSAFSPGRNILGLTLLAFAVANRRTLDYILSSNWRIIVAGILALLLYRDLLGTWLEATYSILSNTHFLSTFASAMAIIIIIIAYLIYSIVKKYVLSDRDGMVLLKVEDPGIC